MLSGGEGKQAMWLRGEARLVVTRRQSRISRYTRSRGSLARRAGSQVNIGSVFKASVPKGLWLCVW